jgi:phenylacetate-CoA ligase
MSNAKSWVERKYWNEELETMPREKLEAFQLEHLKDIIKHSYENSPYYKRTWDEAGVPRTTSSR